ncbi:MAG: hypothetical protein LBB91_10825 [Clostridiales bacterium]|jgi:hypothetical protein|nr:hypothetical protein [Clostridiales bacterium]
MKRKRRKKSIRFSFADFWALGLFILIIAIAISRLTSPWNPAGNPPKQEIVLAAPELNEEQIPARALLVLPESLITAPEAGEFTPLAQEGERVVSGQQIGQLTQPFFSRSPEAPIPVITCQAGILSYELDGLEGVINAGSIQNQDLGLLFSLEQPQNPEAPASAWSQNRPLAKIISQERPFYLLLSYDNKQSFQPAGGIWQFTREDGHKFAGQAIARGNNHSHQYILLQLETIPPLTGPRSCSGYIMEGSKDKKQWTNPLYL